MTRGGSELFGVEQETPCHEHGVRLLELHESKTLSGSLKMEYLNERSEIPSLVRVEMGCNEQKRKMEIRRAVELIIYSCWSSKTNFHIFDVDFRGKDFFWGRW